MAKLTYRQVRTRLEAMERVAPNLKFSINIELGEIPNEDYNNLLELESSKPSLFAGSGFQFNMSTRVDKG